MDVTRDIAGVAGTLTARHLLRGFDAVHLASAIVLEASRDSYPREASRVGGETPPPTVRLMTYDGSLFAAARKEDVAYETPDPRGEAEAT